jgi:glycosyltransferase involved in cell wall biosynthesis
MFNEEQNLNSTLQKVKEELVTKRVPSYEIIFVNDGSTDDTWAQAQSLAASDPHLRVVGYPVNIGRGKALRTGIQAATGDIVITIDFDLTYSAAHIGWMLDALNNHPEIDVILASCYMPGGQTIGVPARRLWVSRLANKLYQYAYSPKIYTSTCVVRAYRREAIKNIELNSDDKEIHLEILTKVLANGFRVKEIPATLERRSQTQTGKSRETFKFKAHSISHILYFIQERPFYIFGAIGFLLFLLSLAASSVLLYSRFSGDMEFNETFISQVSSPSLVITLMVAGIQFMGLGFLGIQNNLLKREMFRMQRMLNESRSKNGDR